MQAIAGHAMRELNYVTEIPKVLPADRCSSTITESVLEKAEFFTVVFYGLRKFRCKTAQLCVTHCEC